MVEMIAAIEAAQRNHLHDHADQKRCHERKEGAENETVGHRREGGGEIGAEHVERPVRQIDEIHDAENERQACGKQKQQQAELQPVQALFDKQQHVNAPRARGSIPLIKRDGSGVQPLPSRIFQTITTSSGIWRRNCPGCP